MVAPWAVLVRHGRETWQNKHGISAVGAAYTSIILGSVLGSESMPSVFHMEDLQEYVFSPS